MDIKINREVYRDKVYACWLGKNIGGTMGTPFEGSPELLDIKGFTTPKGEPLPNDDLDLQLVWLEAIRSVGAKGLNSNILSWYWRRYIPAIWNEYGTGQNNASVGITPPMSGELYNEGWRDSNGAWIRSEIWACLAPAHPNTAVKYAVMEASIDHGVSEGTVAEIFTAALESMAFSESNLRTLIEKALTFIPENSLVAKYVRMVMSEYDKGTDWKKVREKVIEMNKDLGFFQAPGNLAYVVIGLLYGEGDFLKSLIYAIDCGDDTDCTGATVGAILGIIGGTAAISDDLKEYIGDKIVTMAIDISHFYTRPKTCTELTEMVVRTMPLVMGENGVFTEYTYEADAPCVSETSFDCNGESLKYLSKNPLSTEHENHWLSSAVTFEGEPRIAPLGEISFEVTITSKIKSIYQMEIETLTPAGWSAKYPKSLAFHYITGAHDSNFIWRPLTKNHQTFKVTITASETTKAINKVYIAATAVGYPEPLIIPITILG